MAGAHPSLMLSCYVPYQYSILVIFFDRGGKLLLVNIHLDREVQ